MTFKNRRKWKVIGNYCIGWTIALVFLSIVRGVGTEEQGSLQFDFLSSLIMATTLGPIVGIISGYSQVQTEEKVYKLISIKRLLILRLLYAILFLIVVTTVAYGAYQLYFGTEISLIEFAFDKGSFAIYFYFLSIDFLLGILRQVNLMLGENNLWKFLKGEFYAPREESRIFMFIDLKSSTSIAERLGHIEYSKLIQDCFNDLGVVIEYQAEIYQYVGDEAVLTWKLKEGVREANCLKAFFRFKEQLAKKEAYYESKYQCKPFFKAGLHSGVVTVTEVGKFKKEIAYHGDAINTAARIQGQCNQFDLDLLISANLKDLLESSEYNFDAVGDIALKGKENNVSIYAVT